MGWEMEFEKELWSKELRFGCLVYEAVKRSEGSSLL